MFRKHGRTAIHCPMILKHKTLGIFEAITKDISATGILITSLSSKQLANPVSVNIGDELIAMLDTNDEGPPERLRLKVARLANDGVALMFV